MTVLHDLIFFADYVSILKASWFFLCVSKGFFFFCFHSFFFLFHFLVSDSSSSSSLSRTESPLHLFVSSPLHSHPKPDIFVWPPAAHSFSDPGPRHEPSFCKHGFSFSSDSLPLHLPVVLFSDNLPTDKLARKCVREDLA